MHLHFINNRLLIASAQSAVTLFATMLALTERTVTRREVVHILPTCLLLFLRGLLGAHTALATKWNQLLNDSGFVGCELTP